MMNIFDALTLPNGTTIPNRLAKAAMEENMATLEWCRFDHYRKCHD